MRFVLFVAALLFAVPAAAQGVQQTKGNYEDKFRQLDEVLPDPSATRNASGAPGHQYWQQKVDYKITATLDESKRRLTARATVRYTNNSPDALPWLWMQLDQNIFKRDSMAELTDVFGGAGRRAGSGARSGGAPRCAAPATRRRSARCSGWPIARWRAGRAPPLSSRASLTSGCQQRHGSHW